MIKNNSEFSGGMVLICTTKKEAEKLRSRILPDSSFLKKFDGYNLKKGGKMADICEAESCNNKAEYFDETDNRICEEHMHQDMEETGNESSDYEKINEERG